MNTNTLVLVRRVYDNAHIALWASLLAFVVWFAAFVAPNIPEAQARAQSQRILDIAAEHQAFCGKLGMKTGTPAFQQCLLEAQAFRANVEMRLAQEMSF